MDTLHVTLPARHWQDSLPPRLLIWAGLLLLFLGAVSQGAINGTSSVEWRVCSAKMVAVGRISEVKTTKRHSVHYEDCVFEVSENIKGPAQKQIPFTFRHVADPGEPWVYPRGEVLIFFDTHKDPWSEQNPNRYRDADAEKMYQKTVPMGNGDNLVGYSIIPLDTPLLRLYDNNGKPIESRDELITLTRLWSRSPITESLQLWVKPNSPIFKAYWTLSAVFFIVPAEEKFRAGYLKKAASDQENERWDAAANLGKYPGPDSEAALRKLLEDNTEHISASDSIYRFEYPVRGAAYYSLKKLGKPVPANIFIERMPTLEEQRKHREDYWKKHFAKVVPEGWQVLSAKVLEVRARGEERELTAMEVTLNAKGREFEVSLVPYQWNEDQGKGKRFIGLDSSDLYSDSTRAYFVADSLSEELVTQLQKILSLKHTEGVKKDK